MQLLFSRTRTWTRRTHWDDIEQITPMHKDTLVIYGDHRVIQRARSPRWRRIIELLNELMITPSTGRKSDPVAGHATQGNVYMAKEDVPDNRFV